MNYFNIEGLLTLILTAFVLVTLLVFSICIFSYRQGLKDGYAISNNRKVEKIIKQPKAGRKSEKATEDKALEDSFAEGLLNIQNYFNRHRVKEGDNDEA